MFCWLCALVLDLWTVVVRSRKLVLDAPVLPKWSWKSYGDAHGAGARAGDARGGDARVSVGQKPQGGVNTGQDHPPAHQDNQRDN